MKTKRWLGFVRERTDWQGSYGRNKNYHPCRKPLLKGCGGLQAGFAGARERCDGHLAAYLHVEEHMLEKICESPRVGEPKQQHHTQALMDRAQPLTCMGQIGVSVAWRRGLNRKEEQMHEQDGLEGINDLCPDERQALSGAQTSN